jgi:hypothetical protein
MLGFTCLWVSFPLRDITRKQLRFFAEHPSLHFGPSSGFHNLSTVSSALVLAGLFHPTATSRVLFRSGASLPPQPPFLIGRSFPPCRCCFAARTHGPTFAGSLVRPRATPLGFEASICVRSRFLSPVIHLAQGRSPLRISCSSRSSLSRRRPPLSRLPSALDVTRSPFTSACTLRCTRSRSSARYRISMFAAANHKGGPRAVLLRVAFDPTSDLSDRFGSYGVAYRSMRGRGRASFDAWLLSRDAFAIFSCPCEQSKLRAFDPRSTLRLRGIRSRTVRHPFGSFARCILRCPAFDLPARVACSASVLRLSRRTIHGLASSCSSACRDCSRRPGAHARATSGFLGLRSAFASSNPLPPNARVPFTPCGANHEHTHCARSYSAYCHRESMASSSPKSPSCPSF